MQIHNNTLIAESQGIDAEKETELESRKAVVLLHDER